MRQNTQRIGRCGELLVQYKLLRLGIESAPMTTDSGIDLVAFVSATERAVTIQVKTNAAPLPGGGKGKLSLSWWLPENCPADFAVFVDLSSDCAWLFSKAEVAASAQQFSSGRHHVYMYVDPSVRVRGTKPAMRTDFDAYLLEVRAAALLAAS